MKRKYYIVIAASLAAIVLSVGSVIASRSNFKNLVVASNNNYWNHYAAVAPTETKHGSKEFWASCSTYTYSLTAPGAGETIREGAAFNTTPYFDELAVDDPRYVPSLNNQVCTITFISNGGSAVNPIEVPFGTTVEEPTKPTWEDHRFTGWSYDSAGHNAVSWPLTLYQSYTLYGHWNEQVNIKGYLQSLLEIIDHDPYSYIPNTMRPENSDNHVTAQSVNYDFTEFNNVSDINYSGYGEQWHMVIDNIKESELFYNVLSVGEVAINSSVVLFNNYLDNNPDDTASHTLRETEYTAMLDFHNGLLKYTIQYNTNLTIPFFGTVTPQIDMTYNVTSLEKTARIQLSENNAMKYIVTDDSYTFGLAYGVEQVSRKAYFNISKDDNDEVEGHVYEFVQLKDKEMIPSCADFYIDDDYTSVVGNKASGITGFDGYINELYETDYARLIGYKVRETFSKWGITKTYNTLWFNLNDIVNINTVKAISNGSLDPHENNHDIYLNGSESIFEPMKNKVAFVSTSRKYDVEMRKQFFYGYNNENKLTEYEVKLPMMFIQDDGEESGENNYSTFESDILSKNGIAARVNLANRYLAKIRADYLSLIDILIANKDDVNGDYIVTYLGSAEVIE